MFHSATRLLPGLLAGAAALALLACGEAPVESRLADAEQMLKERRFEETIPVLRGVLDEKPDLARANYMLGLALKQTQQPSLAVWPLEKALADPEWTQPAGLLLGGIHYGFGAYEDAIRVASRILEVVPDSAPAYRLRAESEISTRQFDPALADTERFAELQPDDPAALVLRGAILSDLKRNDEAEAAFRQVIEKTKDNPDAHQRAQTVLARFLQENKQAPEQAEVVYKEGLAKYPDSALLRASYLGFLAAERRAVDGEKVLREAIEREPENFQLRIDLANNLTAQGRKPDALESLRGAADEFRSPGAYEVLARAYMREREYARAQEAVQKAVDMAPGEEGLRFVLAEAAVLAGDIPTAEGLIPGFERTPRRHFVAGLVALKGEDHAKALSDFEQGLREWPDNVGARFNAGVAAQSLGDWERALNEYKEAARVELSSGRRDGAPFQTDAILQLARVLYRRGDHAGALRFALEYKDQNRPEATLLVGRCRRALGQTEGARDVLESLLDSPQGPEAREELVALELDAGNAARAAALADQADPADPRSARIYALLAERELRAGKPDAALALVDRKLGVAGAASADLIALRGRVLYNAGRAQQAEAEFQRALELAPEHASALADLATLRAAGGDASGAIDLFVRAAAAEPDRGDHAYHAGQLALQLGRRADAERWLRQAVRTDPGHAGARNDLAWMLAADDAQLDSALELASEAYRLDSSANFGDTLGWIHYRRGEYAAAVELLERAAEESPGDATIRFHLGMALARQGESERALRELRQAVQAGGFPELETAQEQIRQLEGAKS